MEEETVRGVHLVPTVAAARGDDLHRRLPLFQDPDLHRGGLGTEQPTAVRAGRQVEIEGVRLVPGRMVGRRVQRIEVVVFGLDLRAVGQRKTQPVKDVHDPVQRLGQHMHRARGIWFARQGKVQVPGRPGTRRRPFPALFGPSLLQRLPQFVDGFAVGRPFRRRHGFQRLEKFLNLPLTSEVAVAPGLLGGGIGGGGKFGEGPVTDPRGVGAGGLGHGRSPRINRGRPAPRRRTPRVRWRPGRPAPCGPAARRPCGAIRQRRCR